MTCLCFSLLRLASPLLSKSMPYLALAFQPSQTWYDSTVPGLSLSGCRQVALPSHMSSPCAQHAQHLSAHCRFFSSLNCVNVMVVSFRCEIKTAAFHRLGNLGMPGFLPVCLWECVLRLCRTSPCEALPLLNVSILGIAFALLCYVQLCLCISTRNWSRLRGSNPHHPCAYWVVRSDWASCPRIRTVSAPRLSDSADYRGKSPETRQGSVLAEASRELHAAPGYPRGSKAFAPSVLHGAPGFLHFKYSPCPG